MQNVTYNIMLDLKNILLVLVAMAVVFLLLYWLLPVSAHYYKIIGTTVVGVIGALRLLYNHRAIIYSEFNLSRYTILNWPHIPFTLKTYYVFKKISNANNRLFWHENNNDKYFYTNNCAEQETVDVIIRTCNILSANDSIHRYFELFFASRIMNESLSVVHQFSKSGYCHSFESEDENYAIKLCTDTYFVNSNTLSTFFELKNNIGQHDAKKPDLCLKVYDKSNKKNYNIIIDVYNGASGKRDQEKYQKYNVLRRKIKQLYIVIICTNPIREKYSQVVRYDIKYLNLDGLPADIIENCLRLGREDCELISMQAVLYLQELQYWHSCLHAKQIVKTQRRK